LRAAVIMKSLRKGALALAVSLGVLATAGAARAEVIELLDKTRMNGKILHYYDGVYTVETGGNAVKIPREKIKSISFQLPTPRAEFSTVEKTFERWRKALADGDMERVIDCYALMYQGFLASQMSQVTDGFKKMQKELEGWKFEIKGNTVKGETAALKVLRKKGEESDTGDIAFIKENGEWKMLPPQ
jgi:ketosteroid isomerase-like protein